MDPTDGPRLAFFEVVGRLKVGIAVRVEREGDVRKPFDLRLGPPLSVLQADEC